MNNSRNYQGEKYSSVYRGIVSKIADPENRGRIKMIVPSIFNNNEETDWALPCFSEFSAISADIGTPVWVMFEDGDISTPVWIGTWHTTGALLDTFIAEKDDVIYSRDGDTIKVNNAKGEIIIFNKYGKVIFIGEDEIHITDTRGNIILIDSVSNSIELSQSGGNKIQLSNAGVNIVGNLFVNNVPVALVGEE